MGDLGSIPGLGRSPGDGNSYPLQYSCLENSKDRGAWRATVHGVTKSRTWLSDFLSLSLTHTFSLSLSHTPTYTHACTRETVQVSVNRPQESYLQLNSFECAILLSKVIEGSFLKCVWNTCYTQDYILTLTYLFFLILPSHWATLNLEQPETSLQRQRCLPWFPAF